MRVDLKYSGEVSKLFLRVAKAMGYNAVFVNSMPGDLGSFGSGVRLLPRYEVTGRVVGGKGLKVLRLGRAEDLEIARRLIRVYDVIELGKELLPIFKPKVLKRIAYLRKPTQVNFWDIIGVVKEGKGRKLRLLVHLVEEGAVELVVGSGASQPTELVHPESMVALLEEIGLTTASARKSVYHNTVLLARRFLDIE